MLSNEDEALLQDAAFQLIASSVDPKALFQEMVSLSKKARLDSTNSLSGSLHVENLLSVTCEVGAPEKYENSVLATPVLAKQVLDLASTFPFPCSSRDRNTECQLPLEMLWRLHECQAIQLDAYLASKVCEKSFQCSVVKDLVKLCQCTQADRPGKRKVLAGLTSHFLLKGYLVENSSLRKVYTKMLDGVLEALIDVPESGDESPRPLLLTDFSDFEENFPVEALRKFSLHALSVLLAYKAELSAEESLRQQGDWDQLSTHDTMREMMKQLFLLLDCEEVVGCLERFLAAGRINVRSVYTFSSALLVSYENAAPVLSDFVKKRLSEAVESSSVQQVACALLLSRLSSLLGPHLFPPYQDWFQDAVGKNSSSVAPTKSTFLFLVNFLSSLVPVERPEYLKAHILRRPYVPPKGKETYEDYVILAKTRLVDLKVPLNDVWGGIYDNPSSSSVSTVTAAKADAAEQDVEKAVQAFADSGKIPTALIEASIFRKPYFIGKFLAALLKPRLLPDEPDMRMKLIEEVKRSGRIPENLYSRYQEGCHKERQALLEGVFDVDDDEDDEVEEMALPPLDQVQHRLGKFARAVLEWPQEKGEKVSESLTVLCDRVRLATAQTVVPADTREITVSLHTPTDERSPPNIVVTKVVQTVSSLWRSSRERDQSSDSRVTECVVTLVSSLLAQCPALTQPTYTRLLHWLTHGGPRATAETKESCEDVEITAEGVALMCLALMVCHRPAGGGVSVDGLGSSPSRDQFSSVIEAAVVCLKCSTAREMEESGRFLSSYASAVLHHCREQDRKWRACDVMEVDPGSADLAQLLPPALVKLLNMLIARDEFGHKQAWVSQSERWTETTQVTRSSRWAQLVGQHQLTLDDLMTFELRVKPSMDSLSLSARMSYLWHTVSAFMGSVHGLATEMFFKLVQHRSQGSGSWKGHGGQGAGHNDGSDFLLLLKHLVLQLPSCEGNARPWLASCLADSSTSAQLSSSLRLAMGLPAHLLFCNSIHEMVRDHHGQHFLSNLRCFSKSNLNTGGCLSLDATVFVLQGFSCMTERFEPELCEMLLSDPMVTTSVLVHKATLESVNLLRNLPMDWMDQCLQAFVWAQRTVTGENVPECCEKVSPYMKAAAVFALCPDRRSDEKLVPNLQALDPQVLDFVLELTMCRITWNVDSCSLQDTADMTLVAGLLSLRPESLCSLLTHGAHEWTTRVRHSLGLACSGQHRRLRDYLLLRTLEKLALTDLCRRGSQVPSCVLSAYCQLLGHYFEDTDFVSQVVSDDLLTLAKLMSGLVEVSSGEHLRQMDLTLLRHTDPVLYRKVLHKR